MPDLNISNHRGICRVVYDAPSELVLNNTYTFAIVDQTLTDLYPHLIKSLSCPIFYILACESNKNLSRIISLLEDVESADLYPLSKVLVVGGGITQDISATALSLIKRGVSWDFWPTTLLAQSDSCIGSKTSINSSLGKNLYGTFYPPCTVFISPSFCQTLSDVDVISGLGDSLHYLFLDLESNYQYVLDLLISLLSNPVSSFTSNCSFLSELCYRCHLIKKIYIESDEFDQGCRKILNLGHSFAHAIESFTDFRIPHGVAGIYGIIYCRFFGLYQVSSVAHSPLFVLMDDLLPLLIELVDQFSPIKYSNLNASIMSAMPDFMRYLSKDKKNTSLDSVNLVLLTQKGFSLTPFPYTKIPEVISTL